MSAFLFFAVAPLAFLPSMHPVSRTPPQTTRSRAAVAYLDEPNPHQLSDARSVTRWTRTETGLSYRDDAEGDGDGLLPGQIVKISFTVTPDSTGQVVVQGTEAFELGSRGTASNRFFEEAISGLSVGGKRRVRVLPSSEYAIVTDDTVQFDIKVDKVLSGLEVLGYQAGQNRRFLFQLVLLLTFAPDILNFLGVPPPGSPLFVFDAPGFGAVDVLSNVAPAVDAGNQWAVDGLKGVLF
jgi:hypothetical protein